MIKTKGSFRCIAVINACKRMEECIKRQTYIKDNSIYFPFSGNIIYYGFKKGNYKNIFKHKRLYRYLEKAKNKRDFNFLKEYLHVCNVVDHLKRDKNGYIDRVYEHD